MSNLSIALRDLLDESNLFSRDQWAYFLGVPESRIGDWLTDSALPRPCDLSMIEMALDSSSGVNREALISFSEVKSQLVGEASPLIPYSFGTNVSQTVSEYMSTPQYVRQEVQNYPGLGINVVPEGSSEGLEQHRDECIALAHRVANIVTIRIDSRSQQLIACGPDSAIEELERLAAKTGRATVRGV